MIMGDLTFHTIEEYLQNHKEHAWSATESRFSKKCLKNPKFSQFLFGSSVLIDRLKNKAPQKISFGRGGEISELPKKWDWRNDASGGWVTPVKDQDECKSCVAFGTIAALESVLMIHHFKDNSKPLDYSEAFLYFCLGKKTCNEGWIMDDALECIMRDGVPIEKCLPYQITANCDKKCPKWMQFIGPTKNITYNYTNNNITEMKRRIKEYGPQIAAMEVWADFKYYKNGVYKPIPFGDGNDLEGHHCICVVGYDDTRNCWICKNSWSGDWGDGGFFMIDYYSCRILEFGFYTIIPGQQSGDNTGGQKQVDFSKIEKYLAGHKEFKWLASETVLSTKIKKNPELSKVMFGSAVSIDKIKQKATEKIAFGFGVKKSSLPTSWDWRVDSGGGWTTSVKDQESCGSCVAFGTVAALESALMIQYYRNNSKVLDLSEAFLFFCSGQRNCDAGWYMDDALQSVMRDGVPPENCLPYRIDADCTQKCNNWQNLVGPTKEISYNYVNNNPEDMKRRIKEYGPQIAAMEVWGDFIYYKGGIYKPIPESEGNVLYGYHCVCVVGYDDGQNCWICKNSWSDGWGDGGYFKMDYNSCRIVEFGFYTIIALPAVDKKVVDAFDHLKKVYYFDVFEDSEVDLYQLLKLNQNNMLFLEKLLAVVDKIVESKLEDRINKIKNVFIFHDLIEELKIAKKFLVEQIETKKK